MNFIVSSKKLKMSIAPRKKIYFHVGTGKTGTTFLQYRVFPKLKGLYYIQRTRYNKVKKIINNTKHDKYLVSREFDQQLEYEVKLFSANFPEAIPIIVFRRHDGYIASQYRRFVKNGFTGDFVDFFDLENDKGFFKKQDLNYYHQIQILEKYFTQKPIVLFYENLRNNPNAFIENLAHLMGASIDLKSINLNKKHSSYSANQLKAILLMGKYINLRKRGIYKSSILHLFWRLYLNSIRYATLYIARVMPKSFFDAKPLIAKVELEKVRVSTKDDWEKCEAYS